MARVEHSTNPIEPIHQFQITNLIPLGNWGGQEIAFTNSALFMVLTVGGGRRSSSCCRRRAGRWFRAAGS